MNMIVAVLMILTALLSLTTLILVVRFSRKLNRLFRKAHVTYRAGDKGKYEQ